MQTYFQSKTNRNLEKMRDKLKEKMEKIISKQRQLSAWVPLGVISSELREQIESCREDKWVESKDINLKSILESLPKKLSKKLKTELCKKALPKVSNFLTFGPFCVKFLQCPPPLCDPFCYIEVVRRAKRGTGRSFVWHSQANNIFGELVHPQAWECDPWDNTHSDWQYGCNQSRWIQDSAIVWWFCRRAAPRTSYLQLFCVSQPHLDRNSHDSYWSRSICHRAQWLEVSRQESGIISHKEILIVSPKEARER